MGYTDDKRPELIILVGLSGSGKSSTAKELSVKHDAIIVSSDSIREELCGDAADQSKNTEVLQEFHKRISKNVKNGKSVIADATNLTIKSRAAILNLVSNDTAKKICYIITKLYSQCKIDNVNREHPVPDFVLENQWKKFQIPFREEGFEEIVIWRTDGCPAKYEEDEVSIVNVYFEKMNGYDQNNPHHCYCLGTHCYKAYQHWKRRSTPEFNWLEAPWFDNAWSIGAILHDIGKLYTRTTDEMLVSHYYGHDSVGSYELLTHYNSEIDVDKMSDDDLLDACFLINYHMRPMSWNSDKVKEKWKRRFGEIKYGILTTFHECDIESSKS